MTHRVVHPLSAKPHATQPGKGPGQQPLRVLAATGGGPLSSVAMPSAMTELSELLADDDTLCIRRPAVGPASSRPDAESRPLPVGDDADAQLAEVAQAWPRLTHAARTAILAMIEAVAGL